MSDLDSLRKIVESVKPLSQEAMNDFLTLWSEYVVKRKEILTSAGEREKYLYFVIDGVQRIFYLDEHEREATIILTYAPDFGGVLNALLTQKPSAFYYESLTPSKFLRAPYEKLSACMKKHHDVAEMLQLGVAHAFSGVLDRMVELQCFSSEEKFRQLLKRSPHILKLVPHKYLANYLGIDATNFSKLINSIRI